MELTENYLKQINIRCAIKTPRNTNMFLLEQSVNLVFTSIKYTWMGLCDDKNWPSQYLFDIRATASETLRFSCAEHKVYHVI